MCQQRGTPLLRAWTSAGVFVIVLLVQHACSGIVQALRFQPEDHETWSLSDSEEGALSDNPSNLDGDDNLDSGVSDNFDMPSFAEGKSETIANLDPEQTVGRWHAEKEQGTKPGDFLDKILGTKDVRVTESEWERVKTFAEQQSLDAEQATSIWKKFKRSGSRVVKQEGEKEGKTWGETIGDAVDYAGDKIAEGWSALVSRFTDKRSDEAASEAAAKTAAERGDLRGAVREHSEEADEGAASLRSVEATEEAEKAAHKEARRLVEHDTTVPQGAVTKVECSCKKVGPHTHHQHEKKL
ncbi:hypothetical protein CSUI_000163 [Cystoisospora suis]|uniref:Uncharacterized protein n=1 Tax=Cystoisospora suis TaxID=483139 RepID=A0A2C6LHW3_9APIC|nr:hypothetical protein CSUI_000163 [Cystoisospora suis]